MSFNIFERESFLQPGAKRFTMYFDQMRKISKPFVLGHSPQAVHSNILAIKSKHIVQEAPCIYYERVVLVYMVQLGTWHPLTTQLHTFTC
jgi:hypothetical protein